GYSAKRAAILGLSEVAAPVIASVLTTIAAFAPLLFLGGVFGQFMRPIPAVVIIALAVSLVEAILILPVHVVDWSPRFDRKGNVQKPESTSGIFFDYLFGWAEFLRFRVNWFFIVIRADYLSKMSLILRWRYLFLLFMIGLGAFISNIFMQMPKGFMNWAQINEFSISLELPKGSSIEQTERMLGIIEQEIFSAVPKFGIESLSMTVGRKQAADMSIIEGKNVGEIKVTLMSPDEYERILGKPASEDFKKRGNVEKYLKILRRKLSSLPVKDIETKIFEGGPPVGKDIELRLCGDDIKVLGEISRIIRARLDKIPGIYDIADNIEVGSEELKIEIDEEKAKFHGLDKLSVASTIRAAFDGLTASTLTIGEDDVDVIVRFKEKYRQNVSDLLALAIKSGDGEDVPLKTIVKVVRKTGTAFIRRYERKRTVTVYGQVEGMSAQVGSTLAKDAAEEILDNYQGYSLVVTGASIEQQKTFKNLGTAMIITFFLIFIILSAVLKSVMQPFIIMAIIPFGLLGAVLGLFVTGSMFTLNGGIGAVALLGIVVNDSTVLMSFINNNRRKGNSRWKSILTACKDRMRPILLTTFTTIGGLTGIAIGFGTKTFLADLAIAIIGGLLFATILTLAFVPVLYAIYEDIVGLFRRKKEIGEQKVDAREYKRMLETLKFSMSQDEKAQKRVDAINKITDILETDSGRHHQTPDDFEV
ncbi:MAG: efflux RND transporter permease subunit, partial [Planctomycetes bacterium]|nr:efflux RND transporter permease subunit [Planctomycetota bacterium]